MCSASFKCCHQHRPIRLLLPRALRHQSGQPAPRHHRDALKPGGVQRHSGDVSGPACSRDVSGPTCYRRVYGVSRILGQEIVFRRQWLSGNRGRPRPQLSIGGGCSPFCYLKHGEQTGIVSQLRDHGARFGGPDCFCEHVGLRSLGRLALFLGKRAFVPSKSSKKPRTDACINRACQRRTWVLQRAPVSDRDALSFILYSRTPRSTPPPNSSRSRSRAPPARAS